MACRVLLSVLLVLAWSAPAQADIFKCIDPDGREWIKNFKVPGLKCTLVMKTGTRSKPPKTFEPPMAVHKVDGGKPTRKSSRSRSSRSAGVETGSLSDRMELYAPYVTEASEKYQVPESFILAVIRVESSFQYKAESGAGAQGLMQLMPKTARAMGVNDPFDPRQNILGGTRFLRRLANKYDGDMVKVLSAYNAGPGALAKKGGIPYEGTEGYVRAVLDHYYRYKALAD